jgi:hypothetical protein
MLREEWGARVLTAALRRLRPRLASGLSLEASLLSRGGDWWSVRVRCRLGEPAAPGILPAVVDGRGTARLGRGWLPGDPRAGRRLQLALAQAVAQVAEGSGLGLGLWRKG